MSFPLGRRIAGRLAIGLADSGVSSAGNLAVSVIAAHATSLSGFGSFATAMLSLILATTVFRSAHGDALILKSRVRETAANAADMQRSTTSVLQLGAVLGLAVTSVGLAVGLLSGFGAVAFTVIVSGTALPLLSLQDHLRWVEYARGASHRGFVNNLVWTVTSTGALIVVGVAVGGEIPPYVCLMLWAYSTAPGILYAVLRGRIPLKPVGRPRWLRPNRSLIGPLVLDFSLTQATAQGAALLVAALSSPLAMAYIRKGQIWMGPATVATMGLLAAFQPILTQRAEERGAAAAVRLAMVAGTVASAGLLVYGELVFLLPADAAQLLAGEGWAQSRPYIGPLAVQAAASMMGGCLGLALRTTGRLTRQVRWRLLLAPLSIVAVAAATELAGPLAGMWAMAVAATVTALAWWAMLVSRVPNRNRRVVCAP